MEYIPLNDKHMILTQDECNRLLIEKQEEKIKELQIMNNSLRKELDKIRTKFPRVFKVEVKGSKPDSFTWAGNGFSPVEVKCTDYYKTTYKFKLNSIDDVFNNTAECIDEYTQHSSSDRF